MEQWIDYINMPRIFLPSVMHSGTVFIRDLFIHSCYRFFVGYLWVIENEVTIINNEVNNRVYQVSYSEELIWLFQTVFFEMAGTDNVEGPIACFLCSHFGESKKRREFINNDYVSIMIKNFPTFIPIRDPLKIILSRFKREKYKRHEKIDCSYQINGLCLLEELKRKNYKFGIIPIDLWGNINQDNRLKNFLTIVNDLDLSMFGTDDVFINNIKQWDIKNNAKDLPYLDNMQKNNIKTIDSFVNNGDLKQLKKLLGNNYDYLKSKERTLRPFLEKLGYKNLLWW